MDKNQKYDVIIVGGSYAGLSAALALGRAIRQVLVIDSGNPCNQQTPHSHNFLTQDGSKPADISALGKSEVLKYPTIEFLEDHVNAVRGENNDFEVSTASGQVLNARKLVFSTGVKDLMPEIPGFASCWGISVIHCPYCHGYEYKDRVTGILANGNTAFEMALMIHNWTKQLSVFTNGKSDLTDEQLQRLVQINVNVIEKTLQEIVHAEGNLSSVVFTDGSSRMLDALYARPPFEQHCSVPEQMGCELDASGYIKVDDFQKTSIAGVFAAGDNTSKFRAVSAAVAAGGKTGAFINHELIAEAWN
ncbi:NAD(P)/FAD-dependent oxidoreductase [Pedobacter nyackensis]|uniref:Thioredoxin reductase n=1 Tax=Pedobacter nyackensis TaxID=475255 RepID=A0A1W2E1J8_9SPHI|nr:NAD(P)/FAD-dependent oxidoreductase [Pedobacter nyackensis]SMD03619.1 Thioredoxin reductase [Pedobacter nyackensis]